MSLSTALILGYIVVFFSSFIVVIGGVATWQVLSDLSDQAKAARRREPDTSVDDLLKAA